MILLCGIPSETPLARVQAALDAQGAKYVWFHQRRFATTGFEWTVASTGTTGAITLENCTYPLEAFTGVYQRLMEDSALPELAGEPLESPARLHCRSLHQALTQWMECVEFAQTRVVNRNSAMASNFSKPYQSQLLAQQGLLIPPTLITSDPEQVLAFRAEHGRLIFKSISGIRSIVRTLEEADLKRLDTIRWCPTQFQAFIPGLNVRVHVVGNEVFATAAVTEATDYRYASRQVNEAAELRVFDLPAEVAERCIRAAATLGLLFAGVDLKITPDGRVYCFEINPSPAFSYYEEHTGQPISSAVARLLQGI